MKVFFSKKFEMKIGTNKEIENNEENQSNYRRKKDKNKYVCEIKWDIENDEINSDKRAMWFLNENEDDQKIFEMALAQSYDDGDGFQSWRYLGYNY